MRSWLWDRIPILEPVTSLSPEDMWSAAQASLGHKLLIILDWWWGIFSLKLPGVTVSAHCAFVLMEGQILKEAPIWALLMGALLEVVDPGHLQAAMVADVARAVNVMGYIAKGINVEWHR